jgi:protein TonB
MRLAVCLIASLMLHTLIFEMNLSRLVPPSLSVSLEPDTVSLKLVQQVKQETLQPIEPANKPTPPPKPTPKPRKLPPKKRATPPPKRKATPPPMQESKKNAKREYSSAKHTQPRMIERAEYLRNPPPEYPVQARRRRQEGTVMLLVNINERGVVQALHIQESSGFSSLDRAAEKAVAKWRFSPATVGKAYVSSKVIVPVRFSLNR